MSNGLLIFCYCMVAYGLSNMMVFGSGPFRIFEHIRYVSSLIGEHFGQLFTCMMCFPANFGWYRVLVVGSALGLLFYYGNRLDNSPS